jgi:hypothetical protein
MERPPSGWIRSLPSEDQIPVVSDYPSAGAIYLLDEDIFYVSDRTEIRIVIMKILNRRGHRYAEVATPYYRDQESMEVRGRTRRKDGTVLELKPEDVHEVSVSDDLRRKNFSLPGVEDGCLIHYEMVFRSNKYTLSGIRYFQNDEPTVLSRFSLVVPKHLRVIYYDSPPAVLDTAKEVAFQSEAVSLYSFAKRDLLPRETEPFMPPSFESFPSLGFAVAAEEDQAQLEATWENTSQWYFQTVEQHFTPTREMKKLAKDIAEDLSSEKEKIEKLFYFVQDHFKVGFVSRSIFDLPETIFSRQVGSSAEISGILYGLLKSVGVQTTPVLVPSRETVINLPDVPMLDWFSHLLLKAEVDGKDLWLDPSRAGNGANCISEPYRGVDGLVVQEAGGGLIRTPALPHAENLKTTVSEVRLTADSSITCETREVYSVPRSGKIRSMLRSLTIQERKDDLAKDICRYCPGAILDTCHFGDLYNYAEEFEVYYRFSSPHYLQRADTLLYLNPNILTRDITATEFVQPVRIFPVMFDQMRRDLDQVIIVIPPSYEVTALPDSIHIRSDFAEFSADYEVKGNLVKYNRVLDIKELMIPAISYKDVKSFFNLISEQDQKQIALRKKG